MARRALVGITLAIALAIACLSVPGSSGETAAAVARTPTPAHFFPSLSRVISVRVRHTHLNTVRNSNARRIGRSLSTLRPTWVSGTLRYARGQYPKRSEIRTWREIRRIVHTTSPAAQFDVVLNALQYRTPAAIRRTMRRLRHKLGNEGWFFDFLSQSHRKRPRVTRAAVASAHAHGEWIGGNVFGLAKLPRLPNRADFWAVQDSGLTINAEAVGRLVGRKPVMYHLHSHPDRQQGGGCRFIERLKTGQRRALIRKRARQGERYGFRVSYPVIFPQCKRARPNGPGNFLYSYNAFRDPPVAREIRRLLNRYDFDPSS